MSDHITKQVDAFEEFLRDIEAGLDSQAKEEFRGVEKLALVRSMMLCEMEEYPPVKGNPDGDRCSGQLICSQCGLTYYAHPLDWRVIGYGGRPFLNIICDGRRVKL